MDAANKGLCNLIKLDPFDNHSTTTKMLVLPWDLGRETIKFINRSSQMSEGIVKGWRRPWGFSIDDLANWKMGQARTHARTSSNIEVQ